MKESIIFANAKDEPIGVGTREEAWAKGIHVRIVRAILRDENGRILSQHRSASKKSYPNCWTDSASGHVDEGESYDSAIRREMIEEIGFETELKFIGEFESEDVIGDKTIREFNAVYDGRIDSTAELSLQKKEVTDVKWFELNELKEQIENHPENFTLGFREAIRRYY